MERRNKTQHNFWNRASTINPLHHNTHPPRVRFWQPMSNKELPARAQTAREPRQLATARLREGAASVRLQKTVSISESCRHAPARTCLPRTTPRKPIDNCFF